MRPFASFFEYLALRPDIRRAIRASTAFAIPLVASHAMGAPATGVFLAFTAQTIALPDLRGAYGMRLLILATMTLAVAGAAFLGVCAGGNIVASVLAMGFIALTGSFWRHVSADYGPSVSVSSALLFLLGLAQPGGVAAGAHLAGIIALGAAGASLLHIVFWPFRPQHPLRNAVAESWVAASDLVAAMRPNLPGSDSSDEAGIPAKEGELRAALDRTFVILAAAEKTQPPSFLHHLEEMRREVVHFAMRLIAFHSAMEGLAGRPDFAKNLPTLDSVLKALSDACRSVAITLISHRAVNFAATEVRMRRCRHLIQVFEEQLAALPGDGDVHVAPARAMLEQVLQILPRIGKTLESTLDLGETRSGFPARLPELGKRSIHSLAAWINPSTTPDPVLVRYALRMAVLTMLAVALYKGFNIPRGYWIAFTIMVVLQPDYGSTRRRAGERIAGTIAGSLLGSAMLWIKMPIFLLDGCATLLSFGFAFFLKTRYDVAVFMVTLMLVVVMGASGMLHVDFMIMRILSNIGGGAVALIAAIVFWPVWEGDKFAALLSASVRANKTYMESILAFLEGENRSVHDLLMAKRRAENANRYAAESLHRMLAEPRDGGQNSESAAALTTYNQRITRAFTSIAVHLQGGAAGDGENGSYMTHTTHGTYGGTPGAIGETLEALARAIEGEARDTEFAERLTGLEATFESASSGKMHVGGKLAPEDLIWTYLAKTITEIRAMALALGGKGNVN